jgi:hypothetical protein
MPLQNIGQRGESKFCMHERAVSPPEREFAMMLLLLLLLLLLQGAEMKPCIKLERFRKPRAG